MTSCLLATLALLVVESGLPETGNYEFDMGPRGQVVAEGCMPVHADTLYTAERGYGLLANARGEFPGEPSARFDALVCDGIYAGGQQRRSNLQTLAFRADLPPGRYAVDVTVDETEQRVYTEVFCDDYLVKSSYMETMDWRQRPEPLTLRFLYEVVGDSVTVAVNCHAAFFNVEEANTLCGIRFRRYSEPVLLRRPLPSKPLGEIATRDSDVGGDRQVRLAIRALRDSNTVAFEEALQAYDGPRTDEVKAGLCCLAAGHLELGKPERWLERAVTYLERATADGKDTALANRLDLVRDVRRAIGYYHGMSWSRVSEETGMGYTSRLKLAVQIFNQVRADGTDPLYWLATWYAGRCYYGCYMENNAAHQVRMVNEYFSEVLQEYPDDRLTRMIMGEQLEWHTRYTEGNESAPEWAVVAREALCRVSEVIDYWVEERQIENGEMGGGYDDDCEMLRAWPVAVFAAGHENAIQGMRRISDGIWNSDLIVDGYSKRAYDVEHSSELISDTLPIMLAVDYGNPVYVERAMATARCMRDVWTGRDDNGFLRFKSMAIGANEVSSDPLYAADVPYNARAVKPIRWLGWYNNNPTAIEMSTEWAKSWLEAIVRAGERKPAGVVPAAVLFPSGNVDGIGENWHWYIGGDYNFPSGVGLLFEHFMACWMLTGDEMFLEAHQSSRELRKEIKTDALSSRQANEVGSQAWAIDRSVSGNTLGALEVLAEGKPVWDYPKDSDKVAEGCMTVIDSTRYNFELVTQEVVFTDRVYMRGTDHLLRMYTGAWGGVGSYPTMAVSWQGTGKNFAAWVVEATERSLDVVMHGFEAESRGVSMRLWRLQPGLYEMSVGSPNGESMHRRQVTVNGRGEEVSLELPSRRTQRVTLRLKQAHPQDSKARPDWAITPKDVAWKSTTSLPVLAVIVHNIGSADAVGAVVEVRDGDAVVATEKLPPIEAPNDLRSRTIGLRLALPKKIQNTSVRVTVRPPEDTDEITGVNNQVIVAVPSSLE